jgi:1,4-alpha-glucan branching enzyme
MLGLSLGMFFSISGVLGCASSPPGSEFKGGPQVLPDGVIFRLYEPDAERVFLVGDFNDWDPTADPMTDENGDGEWTLYLPLPPGRYEYKFVVDGKYWISDPKNPRQVPDGFDGKNSVVFVPPRSSGEGTGSASHVPR